MLCTALCAPLPCGEGRTVGTPRRGGRRRGHRRGRRGRRWRWQDSQGGQRGRGHRIAQVPVDEERQDRTCVSLSGVWDDSCWVEAVCEHSSTVRLSPSVCSTPWHTPALRCSTTPWTLTVDRRQNRTEQNSHMSTIDSRNSSQSTRSSASVMHSFHSCCCCATHSHHSRNVSTATPITTFAVWTLLRAVTSTEHGEDGDAGAG